MPGARELLRGPWSESLGRSPAHPGPPGAAIRPGLAARLSRAAPARGRLGHSCLVLFTPTDPAPSSLGASSSSLPQDANSPASTRDYPGYFGPRIRETPRRHSPATLAPGVPGAPALQQLRRLWVLVPEALLAVFGAHLGGARAPG